MLESLNKRKEEGYWSQKGNQLCHTHLGSEVLEVSPKGQLTVWFWTSGKRRRWAGLRGLGVLSV